VFPISLGVARIVPEGMPRYTATGLVDAYVDLAELAVWVGGFVWLYQKAAFQPIMRLLAPYGRMSLTCYVLQSMIGVPLFYGYGFALYRSLGPFWSLLVGCAMFVPLLVFAHVWLKRFAYGPLEWLWRALTFLSIATPFRRASRAPVPALGA